MPLFYSPSRPCASGATRAATSSPSLSRPAQAKLEVGKAEEPLKREADGTAEKVMDTRHDARGSNPGRHLTSVAASVQAKLTVGAPGDRFEQEADAVAARVARSSSADVQRQCTTCEGDQPRATLQTKTGQSRVLEPTPLVDSVVTAPGPGSPLTESLRQRIEPVLSADLGHVRVHTGGSARDAAADISARAFTHRNHIFLGAGQDSADVTLMAHEATHVVQQGAATRGASHAAQAGVSSGVPSIQRADLTTDAKYTIYTPRGGNLRLRVQPNPEQNIDGDKANPNTVGNIQFGTIVTIKEVRQYGWYVVEAKTIENGIRIGFVNKENLRPVSAEKPVEEKGPAVADAPVLADASTTPDPVVAEQVATISGLLDHWFTSQKILAEFQAASPRGFVELQSQLDMGKVLGKLEPWEIVQLGALGPMVGSYRKVVNETRADFIVSSTRSWGPDRASIFAHYMFSSMTTDDIESVLQLLAAGQHLHETVDKMPLITKLLADRGVNRLRFQDRGFKAVDIAVGVGRGLDGLLSSGEVVRGMESNAAMQKALDLPEPYQEAVQKNDMQALTALTPGDMAFGIMDYASFGLPSTVKGVVYDMPKAIISGVGEIAQGHVATGVEQLTGPTIFIIGVVLGVRGFRRAQRVAAMLELTPEGGALYESLQKRLGKGAIDKVSRWVKASSDAQILVREEGAIGIEALHRANGDVAAARLLLPEMRAATHLPNMKLVQATGEPSTVTLPRRAYELPYTEPDGTVVVRPGRPLDLRALDPNKRYLWIVDSDGNWRVCPEAQGNRYPNRIRGKATESLAKHGDLAAGAGPAPPQPGNNAARRGPARGGGELIAQRAPDGQPTGRWTMNNDSSFTFLRDDGKTLGQANLDAAKELLAASGTDVSLIDISNTSGTR